MTWASSVSTFKAVCRGRKQYGRLVWEHVKTDGEGVARRVDRLMARIQVGRHNHWEETMERWCSKQIPQVPLELYQPTGGRERSPGKQGVNQDTELQVMLIYEWKQARWAPLIGLRNGGLVHNPDPPPRVAYPVTFSVMMVKFLGGNGELHIH